MFNEGLGIDDVRIVMDKYEERENLKDQQKLKKHSTFSGLNTQK